MKSYSECESRAEKIARATAYHLAGRLWGEANSRGCETAPFTGLYSRAEFIAACGIIAEACSHLFDTADSEMTDLDLGIYPDHLQAAVEYAYQGLHCRPTLARPGLDYLARDEGYAGVVRNAILYFFESLVHVAELDLSDRPMDRDDALRLLRVLEPGQS